LKILLAGGGTAGHINPALAIAGYIKEKEPSSEILFVGTKKGMESSLVPKSGYTIKYVEVEGLSKKLTIKNIRSLIHMITAKGKCKKIIKEFRPDVVIGTGGYVCAPAVMAANSLGVPTLIHEQNVFPGMTVKMSASFVDCVAISFEDMKKAASAFVGTHDFSGFCSVNTAVKDFVRTIYDIEIKQNGMEIEIFVTGNGFLYNMVRIIVGTLLDVAMGKTNPSDIPAIIASKDRHLAGETVKAEGLYLWGVGY